MKCESSGCESESTFQFLRLQSRHVIHESYMCNDHGIAFLAEFQADKSLAPGVSANVPGLAQVDFEMIICRNSDEERPARVYLHEIGGTRRIGTAIDSCAWSALVAQINRHVTTRPVTHTAWAATIRELDGQLENVLLHGLNETDLWFDAILRIVRDGRPVSVEVRASDAYTLAVIEDVPIFVAEEVLEMFTDPEGAVAGG